MTGCGKNGYIKNDLTKGVAEMLVVGVNTVSDILGYQKNSTLQSLFFSIAMVYLVFCVVTDEIKKTLHGNDIS